MSEIALLVDISLYVFDSAVRLLQSIISVSVNKFGLFCFVSWSLHNKCLPLLLLTMLTSRNIGLLILIATLITSVIKCYENESIRKNNKRGNIYQALSAILPFSSVLKLKRKKLSCRIYHSHTFLFFVLNQTKHLSWSIH